MNIKMAGIDHSKATIEHREKFSLTTTKAASLGQALKECDGVSGCVIISTCNRTELWISGETKKDALDLFCQGLGVEKEKYQTFFNVREGKQAVEYLFELASGLRSQIFGEDQILTQVKTALKNAREGGYADTILEILFRDAVTAAKKVKTQTKISATDSSIPSRAVTILLKKYGTLEGKRCMVIGNGEMGRLSTRLLVDQGCKVFMTLRQYKKKDAIIPAGCKVIDYDTRVQKIPDVDIIISATLSPHFTLKYEDVKTLLQEKEYVIMDLAVPRDIDPQIATLKNVDLYDVDKLGIPSDIFDNQQVDIARAILKKHADEFEQWYYFRDWVPVIQKIGRLSATEAKGKMIKPLKNLHIHGDEALEIEKYTETACNKVITALLYGLRENLNKEMWQECITALEKSAADIRAKSEA